MRVFEITVLRKICGVTQNDHRRNVDILKELLIERDTNSVGDLFIWTRDPDGQRQTAVYTVMWLHTWIPRKRKTEEKMDQ